MTPHPSRWSFASDAVRAELGEFPETLLEAGEEVKANPVRRVVRSGGYFLKCDRRGAARFRSEWKSAKLLESQGIPVVEYLACGESSRGGCLITRALPDSESVAEYYWRTFVRGGADPEPFLALFAPFLKHILESGLFHPDFHLGNILYDKVKRSFVLVDALGVRRAGFLDRQFRAYRMRRVAMELREILSRERMTAFLSACGIPNADAFYDRALDREADALWREWPKRRRQILAGYPKFTRKIDGVLHAVNPLRELGETVDCEIREGEPAELEKLFLAHFFSADGADSSPPCGRFRSGKRQALSRADAARSGSGPGRRPARAAGRLRSAVGADRLDQLRGPPGGNGTVFQSGPDCPVFVT